jgi:catechol 2,3-dioxygenase-like lactoylglutathione lyase family enzyme
MPWKIVGSKVALTVPSMKSRIDFYTKKLGFKLLEDYGDWAELKGPA